MTLNNRTLFVVWCLGLLLFFRLELFISPLGHDEAIYAYMGQQTGQGAVLYRDVTDNKPPVIFWAGALVSRLPGVNQINFLIFDTLISGLSVLLFYLIIRKYTSAVFWPTTAFIVFTNAHRISQGGFLTEHYLLFFALLGWWFWLREKPPRWTDLLSGACFGLAFLSKQVALATLAGLGLYALVPVHRESTALRRYLYLLCGFTAIVGLTLVCMYRQDVLAAFWQDCFADLILYSQYQGNDPFGSFLAVIIDNLASAGLFWFMFFAAWSSKTTRNKSWRWLFIFCLFFEFLAFISGKTFYGHQILPLAPALGLFIAVSLPETLYERHKKLLAVLLALAMGLQTYYTLRALKSFPDLLSDYRTAEYIKQNTKPADYLYAAHENVGIAFLAKRRHFYKRPYMAYPFAAEERKFIQQKFDRVKPVYVIDDLPVYARAADYFLEKEIGRYKLWRRK